MMDWARMPAEGLRATSADTVYSRARHQAPSRDLPTTPAAGRAMRAAASPASAWTRPGFDVLYVDCSPPGGGVGVVKVIVPGLEVETMSYYRIGERNARKLIERDSPLIRFGEAERDAAPGPADAGGAGALRRRSRCSTRPQADRDRRPALSALPRAGSAPCRRTAWRSRARGRMSLRFAYNTNGAASHRLDDALDPDRARPATTASR